MAKPSPSNTESSISLRKLIEQKRKNGQMQEALTLAKLGRRVLMQSNHAFALDEVSRKAFELYLELTPNDREVKQALENLPKLVATQKKSMHFPIFLIASLSLLVIVLVGIHYGYGLSTPKSATQIISADKKQSKNSSLKATNTDSQISLSNNTTATISNSSIASSTSIAVMHNSQPIIIRAVGDVVLGTDYPKSKLPNEDQQKKIIELSQSLNRADVIFGNLEGVLSDKGVSAKDVSRPGYFSFRMPEAYASLLKDMGFQVLSVANNHALDFGDAGLQSTINALKAQSIQVSGVASSETAIIEVRNTKIAFLSYSYLPSVSPMNNEEQIKIDIANAKQKANLIFVSVHAGSEGGAAAGKPEKEEYFLNEYRGNIRQFAEFVIDSGADGVFGHGPHVIRPFDIYKEKPIFYSLGNFIGFRTLSTKGKLVQSIIAEVKFNSDGKFLSAGIIPLKMDEWGIPAADYSLATLSSLDGLLDKELEKKPVLELRIANENISADNTKQQSSLSNTPLAESTHSESASGDTQKNN